MNIQNRFPIMLVYRKFVCCARIFNLYNRHFHTTARATKYERDRLFSVKISTLENYRSVFINMPLMKSRIVALNQLPRYYEISIRLEKAKDKAKDKCTRVMIFNGKHMLLSLDAVDLVSPSHKVVATGRSDLELLQKLSDACVKSMHTFENTTIFKLADIFLCLNFWCPKYFFSMMKQFELRVWDGLSRADALHLLFHAIKFRFAPPRLMQDIEFQISDQLTFEMASLICYAYMNTNNTISNVYTLQKIASLCLERYSKKQAPTQELIMILKLFKLSTFLSVDFLHKLVDVLDFTELDPEEYDTWNLVCHISSIFSMNKNMHFSVFNNVIEYIENSAEILRSNPDLIRLKELIKITHALQHTRHNTPKVFVDLLISKLGGLKIEKKTLHLYSKGVLSLAMIGQITPHLLRTAINAQMRYYDPEKTNVYWITLCLMEIVEGLNIEQLSDKQKELRRNLQKYRRSARTKLEENQGIVALWSALESLVPRVIWFDYVGNHAISPVMALQIQDNKPVTVSSRKIDPPKKPYLKQGGNTLFIEAATCRAAKKFQIDMKMSVASEIMCNSQQTKQPSVDEVEHLIPKAERVQGNIRRVIIKVMSLNAYFQGTNHIDGFIQLEIDQFLDRGFEVLKVSPYLSQALIDMEWEQSREVARAILTKLDIEF